MRPLWVKVFLTTVTLQLCLPPQHAYHFGDMIAFNQYWRPLERPLYVHWAIYVGIRQDGAWAQKGDNDDIFHLVRTGYGFGKVNSYRHHSPLNYLDGLVTVRNEAGMIAAINELLNQRRPYNLFANNCEHTATYIRYNDRRCEQRGSICQFFCKFVTQVRHYIWRRKRSLSPKLDYNFRLAAAGA